MPFLFPKLNVVKILFFLLLFQTLIWQEPSTKLGTRYAHQTSNGGYVTYYSQEHRIPALVWYVLTEMQVGADSISKRPSFTRDPDILPLSPSTSEYTNSGYDRGHMAPDADFDWDQELLRMAFYTSNICPQLHALNAGTWLRLENHGRDLAAMKGAVLIVSGPILKIELSKIGTKNDISVPEDFYKVFIYREKGKLVYEAYIVNQLSTGNYQNYVIDVTKLVDIDLSNVDDVL